jgi:hypothetical protein
MRALEQATAEPLGENVDAAAAAGYPCNSWNEIP